MGRPSLHEAARKYKARGMILRTVRIVDFDDCACVMFNRGDIPLRSVGEQKRRERIPQNCSLLFLRITFRRIKKKKKN